jgi:hypothetical protein
MLDLVDRLSNSGGCWVHESNPGGRHRRRDPPRAHSRLACAWRLLHGTVRANPLPEVLLPHHTRPVPAQPPVRRRRHQRCGARHPGRRHHRARHGSGLVRALRGPVDRYRRGGGRRLAAPGVGISAGTRADHRRPSAGRDVSDNGCDARQRPGPRHDQGPLAGRARPSFQRLRHHPRPACGLSGAPAAGTARSPGHAAVGCEVAAVDVVMVRGQTASLRWKKSAAAATA